MLRTIPAGQHEILLEGGPNEPQRESAAHILIDGKLVPEYARRGSGMRIYTADEVLGRHKYRETVSVLHPRTICG